MNDQNKIIPTDKDKYLTYFHAVNSGDLIAALPGMRQNFSRLGRKAVIYQKINQIGAYYAGAVHPLKDEHGNQVTMNAKMFAMLKPLIVSQEYVADLREWNGEKCDYNLNRIHEGVRVNMPWGLINRWTWYVYPELACDLTKIWLELPDQRLMFALRYSNETIWIEDLSEKFIVNRTERYPNRVINYHFLRHYQQYCIFAGTEKEYELFCNEWKLDIPYLIVSNFLELAQAIKRCKFFVGNQSMCWNIAEALKIPRVLEVCDWAQNCLPMGEFAYDCLFQGAIEFYIEQLLGRDKTISYCPVCDTKNFTAFVKNNIDYFKCSQCQTIYCRSLDQDGKVGGEAYAERAEQDISRIERFKKLRVNTVLDFGCGHGELIEAGAGSGLQLFGYDKYNPAYAVFPDVKVDCVALVEVIEHLSYPFDELELINGVLNPDGYLYIETSFTDFLEPTSDYIDPVKGHCTIFSYKALDGLLAGRGFTLDRFINRNTRVYRKV